MIINQLIWLFLYIFLILVHPLQDIPGANRYREHTTKLLSRMADSLHVQAISLFFVEVITFSSDALNTGRRG